MKNKEEKGSERSMRKFSRLHFYAAAITMVLAVSIFHSCGTTEDKKPTTGGTKDPVTGCCCVEEDKNGNFSMRNIDCPSGNCKECCDVVARQGGHTGLGSTPVTPELQKGMDLDKADFSKYKTSLILFSDNTYAITTDDIRTFLKKNQVVKSDQPTIKIVKAINKVPSRDKIVSILDGKYERTKLPFEHFTPDTPENPQPVMGCPEGSYYQCSIVLVIGTTGSYWVQGFCGCVETAEPEDPSLPGGGGEYPEWLNDYN